MCGREAVDGECIDLSTSVCQLYDPTHSSFVIRYSRVRFARFQAAEPSLLAAARVKMSRYAEANPQPGQDGKEEKGRPRRRKRRGGKNLGGTRESGERGIRGKDKRAAGGILKRRETAEGKGEEAGGGLWERQRLAETEERRVETEKAGRDVRKLEEGGKGRQVRREMAEREDDQR